MKLVAISKFYKKEKKIKKGAKKREEENEMI
jgi:hypothetical protein